MSDKPNIIATVHNHPYVKKTCERGRITIWIVDGSNIRSNIDEEFTNFGHHFTFPFIPKNEFWIDMESSPDDEEFYIEHLLVEYRLMERGIRYSEALRKAGEAESKLRKLTFYKKDPCHNIHLPKLTSAHKSLWKKLENDLAVWIVDGCKIRTVFDINFTEGGHDHVYEYIPQNELWIDNDVIEDERPYVLVHELHERNLMSQGLPYSRAHKASSKLEYNCRHHPERLHEVLSREGWA